jgi:LuxR family maltose regulon positive regulatory protein
MQETLLRTKLFFPQPRPNHVPRPRLIGQLNQGLQLGQKLTLISAPAGFGKTTLIAEWGMGSAQSSTPHSLFGNPLLSWLSLDEGDNDLTRFLTYFIAALQTAVPEVGQGALALLQASPQAPAQAVEIALINDLAAVPQNVMIVLDDYHLIDSQEVDDALFFILDNLPPNIHLVIATRVDLNLPLGSMRGRGQLNELRAADLRFNNAEVAAFLNQVMGLNLKPDDIAALEKRTEGWVAGLQLAAISMQGRENIPGLIDAFSGSHRFVLDYLAEEVLKQQVPEVHDFLLQTAVLDRLTGPLCDAVRFGESERFGKTAGGQTMLEMLERANLFIIPLDEERRWYRYHHLFADLLQQRLRQSNPDLIPQLHGRASLWYEANDYLPQAIDQAFAAGELQRAAALVEKAKPQMEATFQSAVWLKWARALPEELVRARPVLCVRYADALIDCGEMEGVEQRLRDAERWLEIAGDGTASAMIIEDEESFQALPAAIALTRSNHASYQGDNAATIKYAELALELIPEENLMQRAQAVVMRGITYWSLGDLPTARKSLVDWMESTRRMGIPLFTVASAFALADILIAEGRLQGAVSAYNQALQLAQETDQDLLPITAHHHLGLAMLYHEMGEEEKVTHHLQISSELGRKSTLIDWPYRKRLAHARLKESAGDLDTALALLDEAKQVYITNPVPDVRPVEALKTAIYLKQGRLHSAQAWAREQGLIVDGELSYLREFEHLTLARVLIAEYTKTGDKSALQQAEILLDRLLETAEEGDRTGSAIEILIVQALAHQAGGDIPAALSSLERALSVAEPEGYLRIFLDEGAPLAQLLTAAAALGIMPAYTRKLLDKFPSPHSELLIPNSSKSDIRHRSSEAATSDIVEPLSSRELEVLQLIADGLTNKQIADRLYLSRHTIKVHTRNIYAKLDAHHRTQAVARARELGLI